MATFLKRITKRPFAIASEATNVFVGSGGKIYNIVIATKVKTVIAVVHPDEVTAMASDGTTYLYVGTNQGRIVRVTMTDGTKVEMESVPLRSPIISMFLKTATLYIGCADGKIYTRSSTP